MLLVLLCLFKDTSTGPFLGWPTTLAGSSRTAQTLHNCYVYLFKVGCNPRAPGHGHRAPRLQGVGQDNLRHGQP
jgi:hypothetical protein